MPNVISFILRFTYSTTSEEVSTGLTWYGLLRNVETNEQIRFTSMEEALAFLDQYVAISQGTDKEA